MGGGSCCTKKKSQKSFGSRGVGQEPHLYSSSHTYGSNIAEREHSQRLLFATQGLTACWKSTIRARGLLQRCSTVFLTFILTLKNRASHI